MLYNYLLILLVLNGVYSIRIGKYNFENRKIIKFVGKKFIKYSIKLSILEIYREKRYKK